MDTLELIPAPTANVTTPEPYPTEDPGEGPLDDDQTEDGTELGADGQVQGETEAITEPTTPGIPEGACLIHGVVYQEGDDIPNSNPCKFCQCVRGQVSVNLCS